MALLQGGYALLSSLFLPLIWSVSTRTLEIVDPGPTHRPTCSKGLTHCKMKGVVLPIVEGPANVNRLDLKVFLCCKNRRHCKLCLRVQLFITVQDQHREQEVSGDYGEDARSVEKPAQGGSGQEVLHNPTVSSVKVCYSFPNYNPHCKKVSFRCCHSAPGDPQSLQVWLLFLAKSETFGSPVLISTRNVQANITIPSLQDVCSPDLDGLVKACDVPRLHAVTDQEKGVALLRMDSNKTQTDQMAMCQMFGTGVAGVCRYQEWPPDQREMTIPLDSIAPCLCFQVWWKGKDLRNEVCPFINHQEIFRKMLHNVSVSVMEVHTRGDGTALAWNLTAPCRLGGELWLCRRDSVGGQCEELRDSRQRLYNHTNDGWIATLHGHWKCGEFLNVSPHPALCVQVKVQGMDSDLELICPFTSPRRRWTLTLIVGLLLICLTTLGACVLQGALKGYVWRWLKGDDIEGAVGGSHVVLLYPPDGDQALPGLVCRLGSSLQTLGFSVSLDLWSRGELSVLGPVPWLHSRLDRLQRQGGKVILVLSQAAWERAEDWGRRGWERERERERDPSWGRKGEADEGGEAEGECRASSPYSDVFSASLSCILADYLQGRAGERFALVQFESLPPLLAGGNRPLPELFRGLPLFSLPSQSLGFLTELAVGSRGAAASGRRRRAGGLRAASRALAGGLRGFAGGSSVFGLAGLPQDCVGAGVEDPWENVPLQSSLTTPPSSPDSCTKNSGVNCV